MKNNRVAPGDLVASSLWERVTTDNKDLKMPGLKTEELQILSEWILTGAQEFERQILSESQNIYNKIM